MARVQRDPRGPRNHAMTRCRICGVLTGTARRVRLDHGRIVIPTCRACRDEIRERREVHRADIAREEAADAS